MRAYSIGIGAAVRRVAFVTAAAGPLSLLAAGPGLAQSQPTAPPQSIAALLDATANEPVKGEVSVTTAGGYARIVFRMAEPLDAQVRLSGNILILTFSKPIVVPIEGLSAGARDYISVARRDPDGMALRIALKQKVDVNKQLAGERIYFDLLPPTWTGVRPGLPQEVVEDLARRAQEAERKLRAQMPAVPAVPTVRVKVGTQPTFTRYIFEMPPGVSVNTERTSELLRLKFSSPINFDLADTRDGMPAGLSALDSDLDQDFVAVNFRFTGPVELRSFREDRNMIVDVGTTPAKAAAAKEVKPASGPAIQAPDTIPANGAAAETKADSNPDAKSESKPDAPSEMKPQGKADVKPEAKPEIKAEAAPAPVTPQAPVVAQAEPHAAPRAPPSPPATALAPVNPLDPPASPPQHQQAAAVPPAEPVAVPAAVETKVEAKADTKIDAKAETTAPAKPSSVVRASMQGGADAAAVTFPFVTPTPAAAFVRADTLWMVFDTERAIDVAAIEQSPMVLHAAVTRPQRDVAVLRMKLDRPRAFALQPSGTGWSLSIGDKVTSSSQDIPVARNIVNPQRASITIPFDDPRSLHRLIDPEQGDALFVVTALGPARGLARTHNFVDLRALASIHGVVVQPLADDLSADLGGDKIVIGRPTGLVLSNAVSHNAAAASRGVALDPQLWGFDRQANFITRQAELIDRASALPAGKRQPARVDLARFYLARDMYPEAKAVLDLALKDDKPSDNDITGVVLRAVANVMMVRPEDALKDLGHPLVGKQHDAPVWRAFALAEQGQWDAAHDAFKGAMSTIAGLPIELQRQALLKAVRAAVEIKDYAGAGRMLDEFNTVGLPAELGPAVAVLQGRIAEGLDIPTDALRFYQTAADSTDREAAAQGRLRALALRYDKGEIARNDMIAELETLTAIWRGDETEVEGQQWLARLYTEENRYRDAFRVMRAAITAHPNARATRLIQDGAAATFESLFIGGRSDALPPVEALGLFYDYRELTPIGRRGDEMIRRLADRLASVELFEQAAELLQHQVDHRLQGAARAQVATRLAVIYLMNRQPDRALGTLRATRIGDMTNELRTQRLLIEARALADVGRGPLALEVIEKLQSPEAQRLRADILWGAKRWAEAGEQFERLTGSRWKDFAPLTPDDRQDVLRAAVAYSMANETIGLGRLRERFAAKMKDSPDNAAFEIATGPRGALDPEFGKVAMTVASYDALTRFLAALRERYPETGAFARPVPDMRPAPAPAPSARRDDKMRTAQR
ncbi:MAG: tetratricopeptide repeat protein [Pseudolabrys sp.]